MKMALFVDLSPVDRPDCLREAEAAARGKMLISVAMKGYKNL